jgi:hypothetical protein
LVLIVGLIEPRRRPIDQSFIAAIRLGIVLLD